MITTVMETSFYGKAMSNINPGGIIIVRMAKLLIVAIYSDPVSAAEAIPQVHRFTDELPSLLGPAC